MKVVQLSNELLIVIFTDNGIQIVPVEINPDACGAEQMRLVRRARRKLARHNSQPGRRRARRVTIRL